MAFVGRLIIGIIFGCFVYADAALAQPGRASPDIEVQWNLSRYPAMVYPSFLLGHLLWDGCSPVYLPGGPDGTCPVFRDEPVGFDAIVTYDGPAFVELFPRGPRWVETWLERADHTRTSLSVDTTVEDASGEPVAGVIHIDGGIPRFTPPPGLNEDPEAPPPYIPPLVHARIHVDLAPAIARLPSGSHTICAELTGITQPQLSIARYQPTCVTFTVQDATSTRARAEHLRRKAIDLLAAFRCEEASGVVSELLQVHPTSAVGYRLRGVIAELQRRHEAAIADYTRAVALLRAGDMLLDRSGINIANAVEGLASWRDSLQLLVTYAPDQSLLGPPGDRPTCRNGHESSARLEREEDGPG